MEGLSCVWKDATAQLSPYLFYLCPMESSSPQEERRCGTDGLYWSVSQTAKKEKSLHCQGEGLEVRQPLLTLVSLNVSCAFIYNCVPGAVPVKGQEGIGTSPSATPSHLESESAEERRFHLTGGIMRG